MIEYKANRERRLTALRKFGPVFGNGSIGIHETTIDQHVEGNATEAFHHRHHADDGVASPWFGAVGILPATPEIDDRLAILYAAEGGARRQR